MNTTLPTPHGSWIKGPGNYTFTVAAYGTTADINGCPGQSIPITMEVWGAGGGGVTVIAMTILKIQIYPL
ncbi:MAG: hypothetical protein IPM96_16710 [Ignavibacteria bacterium]|nr:hypothetical protein [Ignavibacteria bacterium]